MIYLLYYFNVVYQHQEEEAMSSSTERWEYVVYIGRDVRYNLFCFLFLSCSLSLLLLLSAYSPHVREKSSISKKKRKATHGENERALSRAAGRGRPLISRSLDIVNT